MDLAGKLYCPACPNTPLDVCESKACQDWRTQIKDQLSKGWNEEQIIEFFVAQYGERVLAEPQRRGFTSLVWLLPVIAILLGLMVLWRILKIWKAGPVIELDRGRAQHDAAPKILERIEKELQDMG